MLSRVVWTSAMSGRLAPPTSNPIGAPPPSVRTDRLVPILARSVGFLPVFFPPEGGLRHGPVEALPPPVDAEHVVVLVQGHLPEGAEHAPLLPPLEVPVEAAPRPELGRDGLPVAARPQDVEDPVESPAVRQARAAAAPGAADPRQEEFDPPPQRIGGAESVHHRRAGGGPCPPPSWADTGKPLFALKQG